MEERLRTLLERREGKITVTKQTPTGGNWPKVNTHTGAGELGEITVRKNKLYIPVSLFCLEESLRFA